MLGVFSRSTGSSPDPTPKSHQKVRESSITSEDISEGEALRRNASLIALTQSIPSPSSTESIRVNEAPITENNSNLDYIPSLPQPTVPVTPQKHRETSIENEAMYSPSHQDGALSSWSLRTVLNHNHVPTTNSKTSDITFVRHTLGQPHAPLTSALNAAGAPAAELYTRTICEQGLLEQYSRLATACPSGVYVLPDKDNVWVWHGVIFVHSAFYSQGIFRFVIDIPESYPLAYPTLRFTSEVLHPMVSKTGFLDLRLWTPETPYIVLLLSYLKKCFYKPQLWDEIDALGSLNPEFSALRSQNPEKFLMTCREIAEKSVLRVYKKQDHYASTKNDINGESIPSLSSSPTASQTPTHARAYNPSSITFKHLTENANMVLQSILQIGGAASEDAGTSETGKREVGASDAAKSGNVGEDCDRESAAPHDAGQMQSRVEKYLCLFDK